MEAALRTAYEVMTGEKLPKVELSNVRGYAAVRYVYHSTVLHCLRGSYSLLCLSSRKASVMIGDREVKVAVVHGTKRVREIVEAVMAGDRSFDLIEVMVPPALYLPIALGFSSHLRGCRPVLEGVWAVVVSPKRQVSILMS